MWTETKTIVNNSEDLIWHSPSKWEVSSAIMSIEIKNKDANKLSKFLDTNHGIYVRPFQKPVNALRISPNIFNSIDEINNLLSIVTKKT